MGNTPKRIRRIEAELRMKARALRRLKPQLESAIQPLRPIAVERTVGKMARTKTPCSCPKCGNPRRYAKGANRETLAEQRSRLEEAAGQDAIDG